MRATSRGASRALPPIAAGIALLGGCRSYEPKPLRLEPHALDFLAPRAEAIPPSSPESSAAAPAAFDLRDGVTIAEGEAVALVFAPELRIARLEAGVAQAGAAHAGLWDDPVLGVDLARIVESVDDPWKVAAFVSLTIPISGRLDVERALAGDEVEAALAAVAEEEWLARVALREAWIRWSGFVAAQARIAAFLADADRLLAIVDRLEAAGELTRVAARLLRTERIAADAERLQIEAERIGAEYAIRRAIGLSPTAPLDFEPIALDGAAASPPALADAADRLLAASPTVIAGRAAYEVAERTLELEIRRQYPDLVLGPGYGRDEGQDEVLLGIALPLPILNANRRAIAEAEAGRELARVRAEAALERLLTDYAAAEALLAAATRRRATVESELLPAADEQYDELRRLAELGEFDPVLILEALVRRRAADLALVEARVDEALARLRIDALLGPDPAPTSEATP